MRGEERRGSSEAVAQFRRRLATLKRNGCNVLVVGADALDSACERLLGESSAGSRFRLFVTTDARPADARARLDSVRSELDPDPAAVVDWDADVRNAAGTRDRTRRGRPRDDSAAREPDEGLVSETFVESADLEDLESTVESVVESFDTETGGFIPGELRVCVDSLRPLIADYEYENVRRFLLGVSETVERVDGMAHYHLPVECGSEAVETYEPLFDAVVEVRWTGGEPEQRWHLTDSDITIGWLPL